ncbi:unnamed protein product, partial [Brassica oleracea]
IRLAPPGENFSSHIAKLSALWRHDSQYLIRNITSTPYLSNGCCLFIRTTTTDFQTNHFTTTQGHVCVSKCVWGHYRTPSQEIGTDSDSLSESSGKDTIVAKEGEFSEVRGGSNAAVEEKKKVDFVVCLFWKSRWLFLKCLFTVTVKVVKAK